MDNRAPTPTDEQACATSAAPPRTERAARPIPSVAGVGRLVGLTLLGVVAGVVVGYPVGAAAGMLLVGPLVGLGLLRTETGGWTESNILGGIGWLAAAGAVVGLSQQGPLRRRGGWWGGWWVLGSAALWGLVAFASLSGEGRLRAVDLRTALPLAALGSLAARAILLLAARA